MFVISIFLWLLIDWRLPVRCHDTLVIQSTGDLVIYTVVVATCSRSKIVLNASVYANGATQQMPCIVVIWNDVR